MKNKKTKIAILGIIALVLVTIGITYAYWLITRTQEGENVITTGCLDITLNGDDDITLADQFPISDEDGMNLTPYTFTVTNNCNTSVDYHVNLESIGDSSNAISSDALKAVLDENTPKVLYDYVGASTTISNAYEAYTLGYGTLAAKDTEGSTVTYKLRIWIDEDASISEMNKTYTSKISVSVGQGIENFIKITSDDQIYALQRSLLSDSLRSSIGYDDSTYEADFELLNVPSSYVDTESKIEYLRTATYSLENDISVTFTRFDANNQFMAIGTNEKPFEGNFIGNNHVITLLGGTVKLSADFDRNFGFFGLIKNAFIEGLKINVSSDVLVGQSVTNMNYGLVAGNSVNSELRNISVAVSDEANVGIDYSNTNYRSPRNYIGLVVGNSDSSNYKNIVVNMDNSEFKINNVYSDDAVAYDLGAVVGWSVSDNISDVTINLSKSKIYTNLKLGENNNVGGIVGTAEFSKITRGVVNLIDSSIGSEINSGDSLLTSYKDVAVGGILGFAKPGSDNTNNIGETGVVVTDSTVVINNSTSMDSIYAIANTGSGINAGGILGISFNNASILSSRVKVTNGNIVASRLSVNDSKASYGAHTGGIVGRLEHTGRVYNSSVEGNNMIIKSSAGEANNFAGGIIGADVGPIHKNQISVEGNAFNGNSTSKIQVNLLSSDTIAQELAFAGGIAGASTYISKNNNVSNVDVSIAGVTDTATNIYLGNLFGAFNYHTGWNASTYFTPDSIRGLINTSAYNVSTNSNATIVSNNIKNECGYYKEL